MSWAGEQTPEREEMNVPETSLATTLKVEPMNKLVMDLVELTLRQNRLFFTPVEPSRTGFYPAGGGRGNRIGDLVAAHAASAILRRSNLC